MLRVGNVHAMKFYVIFLAVSGLTSALPRRSLYTKNEETSREISDMNIIVAKLPENIKVELLESAKENPNEKLYEAVNADHIKRSIQYIIGGKGKQRYRVKLKKKSQVNRAANNSNIVHIVPDADEIRLNKNADIKIIKNETSNNYKLVDDSNKVTAIKNYIKTHKIVHPTINQYQVTSNRTTIKMTTTHNNNISTVQKPVEKSEVSDVVQKMYKYFNITSEDVRLFAIQHLGLNTKNPDDLYKLELIFKDFLSHAKNYDDADTIPYFKEWLRYSKYWKETPTPHSPNDVDPEKVYDPKHSRSDLRNENLKVIRYPAANTIISSKWLAVDPKYKILKHRPSYVVEKKTYQPEKLLIKNKLRTEYQEPKENHESKERVQTPDNVTKSKHTYIRVESQRSRHVNSQNPKTKGLVGKAETKQNSKINLNQKVKKKDDHLSSTEVTLLTPDDDFNQTTQAHDQPKAFSNKEIYLHGHGSSGQQNLEENHVSVVEKDYTARENLKKVNKKNHTLEYFKSEHPNHKIKVSSNTTNSTIKSLKLVEGYVVEEDIHKPVNLFKLRTNYLSYVLELKNNPNYRGEIKTFDDWLQSTQQNLHVEKDDLYSVELPSDSDNYQSLREHDNSDKSITIEQHFNNNKPTIEEPKEKNYLNSNTFKNRSTAYDLLVKSNQDFAVKTTPIKTNVHEDHEILIPNLSLPEEEKLVSLKDWLEFNSKYFNDAKQPLAALTTNNIENSSNKEQINNLHQFKPSHFENSTMLKYNPNISQGNEKGKINDVIDKTKINDHKKHLLHESIPLLSEKSTVLGYDQNDSIIHMETSHQVDSEKIKGVGDETEINDHKKHVFTIMQPNGQSQLSVQNETTHLLHESIPSLSENKTMLMYNQDDRSSYKEISHQVHLEKIKGIEDETEINDHKKILHTIMQPENHFQLNVPNKTSHLLHESKPSLYVDRIQPSHNQYNYFNHIITSQEKEQKKIKGVKDKIKINDFTIMQPVSQSQHSVHSKPSNNIVIKAQISPISKEDGVDREHDKAYDVNKVHRNEYLLVGIDEPTTEQSVNRDGNDGKSDYVSGQSLFCPYSPKPLEVDSGIAQQKASTNYFEEDLKMLTESIAWLNPYKNIVEIFIELLSNLIIIFPQLKHAIQNEINILDKEYYGFNPILYDDSVVDAQYSYDEFEPIKSREMVHKVQIPRTNAIEGLASRQPIPNELTLKQFINNINYDSKLQYTYGDYFMQNESPDENNIKTRLVTGGEIKYTPLQMFPLQSSRAIGTNNFKDINIQANQYYHSSVVNPADTLLVPKPNYNYYHRLITIDILKQAIDRIVLYLINISVPIVNIRYLIDIIYSEMVEYINHHVITFDCPYTYVNEFIEILKWKIQHYILGPSNSDYTK